MNYAFPHAAPLLELAKVTKTYRVKQGLFSKPKPLQAVDGVDLHIHKKDVLGLVGESGCGKSTLAKILLGLEAPTSGKVMVEGKEIGGQDRRLLSRRIQPIFQDPYSSLNPRKSIEDIIALPLVVHGIGAAPRVRNRFPGCSISSGFRSACAGGMQISFPAASANASRSPGRW